ncbi:MAG TPA: tRNA (adenosine(37)-N6)-threonylcarbamoyltransferase complex dimerization subunit type 1 TsaB [Microbacterium sp.]|uniref:tRNA (adenosine(37)-N6)-threonylcarbamoyltransferase complex dimerization subunit type 1 TsaB n=1 Tax=Microbacterium sp. TaxID=51671 RepID=UPI002BAA0D94|nr:tRNA (adenosine(37)-N6)-threonylcarbamoyltransferase complex dimerization subunit type 1 TsaB [Microbacterium sp.]HWI31673.1 tRNA (adenosine(37)-N6)-threonylcarbamoyltransferase complex dimerization subunit type 1 TsaB [Microbacterium sp.]
MILAVDTSIGSTVVVVDADGVVHGSAVSETRLGHAEAIGLLLEQALAQAAVAPSDITHVVAGMGPGPFTGLRIGIAAARVFALARAVPFVPVVSHDAVALAGGADAAPAHAAPARAAPVDAALAGPAPADAARSGRFAVVTDARRREIAVTLYDGVDDDGMPRRIEGPKLQAAGTIGGVALDHDSLRVVASIDPEGLGLLAARAIASGRGAATSEPLYLRAPDVTLGHTPKRVRA